MNTSAVTFDTDIADGLDSAVKPFGRGKLCLVRNEFITNNRKCSLPFLSSQFKSRENSFKGYILSFDFETTFCGYDEEESVAKTAHVLSI